MCPNRVIQVSAIDTQADCRSARQPGTEYCTEVHGGQRYITACIQVHRGLQPKLAGCSSRALTTTPHELKKPRLPAAQASLTTCLPKTITPSNQISLVVPSCPAASRPHTRTSPNTTESEIPRNHGPFRPPNTTSSHPTPSQLTTPPPPGHQHHRLLLRKDHRLGQARRHLGRVQAPAELVPQLDLA